MSVEDANDGLLAVDWGTTNRRAYRLDAAGAIVDRLEDDRGVMVLSPGEFSAQAAELRARFGVRRLLLAGMVGSNRGWSEAPYLPCPAVAADLAGALQAVELGTLIVPGLCDLSNGGADVMRGEEVQIFGAHALELLPREAFVCHPGTHAKWALVENGAVTRFRTVMTGELFSLLKANGTLSELLQAPAPADEAFLEGVDRGHRTGAVGTELFGVRAGVLLGRLERSQAASLASGVLIGADLRSGLELCSATEVAVIGRPSLTALYAAALPRCGREPREINGETAFAAGAFAIGKEATWTR